MVDYRKLGGQEIPAFSGLVALKKPPLEDYVPGTRRKKPKKKTNHNQGNYCKDNSALCNLFLGTTDAFHSKIESSDCLYLTAQMKNEEQKNVEKKIKKYEEWIQQQHEMNCKRQRHLEKQSLKKQENLAETWLRYIQRRKEHKVKNLEQNGSSD